MILSKNLKKIGRYQLLEVIGKGANGIVYKGLDNETGCSVAIKQVALSQEQLKSVQSEIYLLRELSHQHIVKYVDVLQNEQNCLHIVLEFIEGGSLANLVRKYPLPENLVKVYIRQVLSGLDYLHQMGVVHRDIKGANILLTKDGIVKLADFGVAIRLNEDHRSFSLAGTPYWMAPEIIESKGEISTSCDIWSLGCTVIELLTGNPPYFDLMQYPALFRIVQDQHPPLPEVSPECKDFLLRCFRKQPDERERAGQLIRHKWLEDTPSVSDKPLEEVPAYISFEIKQMLTRHNYHDLSKALTRIPTKRLIYHNPHFVMLLTDKESTERVQFVLDLVRDDWETLRYISTLGLLEAALNISNYQDGQLVKAACELLVQVSQLCAKHADLLPFMTICLRPLRRLMNVAPANESLLVQTLENLLKQDILLSSHTAFILCKEGLLNCLMLYFGKTYRHNVVEAQKAASLIYKVSSIRESHIAAYFKPSVPHLVRYLQTVEQPLLLTRLVKVVYNLAKDSTIANELEFEGVIPTMLQLYARLAKPDLKEETILLIGEVLRAFDTLVAEANRKSQFKQHRGRAILSNSQAQLFNRKDLIDSVCTLLKKLE